MNIDFKDASVYYKKGYAKLYREEYQEAIEYFTQAITLDPSDALGLLQQRPC